ncbi:hypothetical protein EI427_17360 [Flammeovirga pectinis]|uniref:Uncharacterized protein n=1 Tax=Flammeovirga pectinis TaxID=2494373 RepID=A0A3Q9FQV3_9BACT|nr:hypothetical protein [Flammeovirga pectinis]AZQ63929.1 hypothetical protein EI427_17360 [Flammeovirga pectinis]
MKIVTFDEYKIFTFDHFTGSVHILQTWWTKTSTVGSKDDKFEIGKYSYSVGSSVSVLYVGSRFGGVPAAIVAYASDYIYRIYNGIKNYHPSYYEDPKVTTLPEYKMYGIIYEKNHN